MTELIDADRRTDELNEGDDVQVAYKSVHPNARDGLKTVSGTVATGERNRIVFEDDGDTYDLILDDGLAVELKKRDSHGTPRRIGVPDAVAAPDDGPEAVAPNNLDAATLDAGQALELTYDSNNSTGTERVVYVVEVYDRYPRSDGEDLTVVAADPNARRSRFVRFDPHRVAPYLYSLNSKSDTGRRVGPVQSVRPLPSVSDTHAAAAAVRQASVGEVLRVEGDRYVVTADRGSGAEVERLSGEQLRLAARPDGATADVLGEYDPTPVEAVERTGETHHNGVAAALLDACTGYGNGHPDGKVVALVVEGERFAVEYRHEADSEGIRMASADVADARREFDARLSCDPLGLELTTGQYHPRDSDVDAERRRVSAGDVGLVRAGDTDDDESGDSSDVSGSPDETTEAPEAAADEDTADERGESGASDAEVEAAVEAAERDAEPVLLTDGGEPTRTGNGSARVVNCTECGYACPGDEAGDADGFPAECPVCGGSVEVVTTDGGEDGGRGGFDPVPSVSSACHYAHPFPSFEDYTTARGQVQVLVESYVERVAERERDALLATDGGQPRDRDGDAAVEGDATGEAADDQVDRELRERRHETLTMRLDMLGGDLRVAVDRGNDRLYDAVKRRRRQIRRELCRRQVERHAHDTDDGRFEDSGA